MAPGPKYESAEALEPGRGRKGSPVHTRHDPRRSETHGCKYMGEKCSKVSENHIQKKDGHGAFPAVWATVKQRDKSHPERQKSLTNKEPKQPQTEGAFGPQSDKSHPLRATKITYQ